MADILNLQVKDETLNNIISNNPYYIDIKGSVNICLIRCGQDIEKCNNITFSTMTNYGKLLVLNPDPSKIGMCNIKLAFDNSNDNTNNNGDANYKFEKAFFSVPSFHRLNSQVFDMETFLVFSSVQKNGNVLYVVLCTLSNGTSNIPSDNSKLLNYKLLTELFSKNNTVPDIYGTNPINSVPNPVDISNFIPVEGSRNFYDYTHPLNTIVNFRVYQTPLLVSNDILNILKSKLTPGTIYENFKNAIVKSINPYEGLFFTLVKI
jgi:carbonic anhydrase